MAYVVKDRHVRWRGKSHPRGAEIPVEGDREAKQADLLVRIGKVERREAAPVRQAGTVRAAAKPKPQAAAPEAPVAAQDAATDDAAALLAAAGDDGQAAPEPQTYSTRRLTAED